MATYKVKLACRKDNESNWNTSNPTLISGELGVATHTVGGTEIVKGIKVGAGLAWTDTEYVSLVDVDTLVPLVMNSFGDSPSINFYYDSTDGLYKFEVVAEGIDHVTEVTHAEILDKINTGTLIISSFYRITDYQTVHMIPYTNVAPSTAVIHNTSPIEPLVIQAININALSSVAQSSLFPNDVIYYNVMDVLCEDGVTPRKGKIVYRKDTAKNLETFYDFRNVKFRRWKLNPPAWDNQVGYQRGNPVLGADGHTYISRSMLTNTANDPTIVMSVGNGTQQLNSEYAVNINPNWDKIFVVARGLYWATRPDGFTIGYSTNIPVFPTDFQDFYTFNTTIVGEIGTITGWSIGQHTTYNNIVIRSNFTHPSGGVPAFDKGDTNYNNIFAIGCSDMTLAGRQMWGNTFGPNCIGNIIQGGFIRNSLCASWSYNLNSHTTYLYLGGFIDNRFDYGGAHHNVFAQQSNNNYIAGNYTLCTSYYDYTNNTHKIENYKVNIGFGARNNILPKLNVVTLGNNPQNNTIQGGAYGGGFNNVTVGNDFQWNKVDSFQTATVGNSVQYNTFIGNQLNLNLPNNFQFNKIWGLLAAGTYFAVGTSRNVFNNNFGGGTLAIPLNLLDCVFNKPVSGMQIANTGVILTGVVSLISITNKTFPISLTNEVISAISPDGSLWAHGTDDTGHVTAEKIV